MKIFVNNIPEFEKDIRETAIKVIKGENLKGELSLTFVNDEEMIALNKKYMNRAYTTDVLSFSFDVPDIMGDIYICVSQAERQKEGALLSELKLLTVHGILHLAGYDDQTENAGREMRKKEQEYLRK